MEELNKLKKILIENNIEYINKSIINKNDGIDLTYNDCDISVISHPFSYGGKQGLLEIMIGFNIEGWLTAEETFKIIKKIGE